MSTAARTLVTVRMRLEVAHRLLNLATGPSGARAALQKITEAIADIDAANCTFAAPAGEPVVAVVASMEDDFLVTVAFSVDRKGNVVSDVQTHNNSYSDVAVGLVAVRDEINRVFTDRKKCPYFPSNSADAKKKIIRDAPSIAYARAALSTASPPKVELSQNEKWNRAGREPYEFHPQASHVRPDYRDGWNAALQAVAKFAVAAPAGEPVLLPPLPHHRSQGPTRNDT